MPERTFEICHGIVKFVSRILSSFLLISQVSFVLISTLNYHIRNCERFLYQLPKKMYNCDVLTLQECSKVLDGFDGNHEFGHGAWGKALARPGTIELLKGNQICL